MEFDFIEWDSPDDLHGNVRHIADNGLSIDEVEDVIYGPAEPSRFKSRSSRRPALIGRSIHGEDGHRDLRSGHKDAGYRCHPALCPRTRSRSDS